MRWLALIVALAACGEDKPNPPATDAPTVDAKLVDAKTVDAPPDAQAFVMTVTCPATPDASVTAPAIGSAFVPMAVTIPLNGIVQFTMPTSHSVIPSVSLPSDPGLRAGFNQVTCLKFTKSGTLNYVCNPHGFAGTVTVQ